MPVHPSPQEMAERLFAVANGKLASADDAVAALEHAHERLERVLESVIGEVGYRAIFARSLRKTKAVQPCLDGLVTTESAGLLEPLLIRLRQQEPVTIRAVSIALMTHLVELLWMLIGVDVTLKLLRRAWPEDVTSALD